MTLWKVWCAYQEAETEIEGVQTDLERYEVGVNLFFRPNQKERACAVELCLGRWRRGWL